MIIPLHLANLLADYATTALLEEVHTTPKPGLVDCNNSGSHTDMDVHSFERSAFALHPFFLHMAMAGMAEDHCMHKLQIIGMQAENAMYQATGGVNTHKGCIFAMGLLVAATGASYLRGKNVFERVSELASSSIRTEVETHGIEVQKKYKIGGAREEAIKGLPNAQKAYEALKKNNGDGVYTLLSIMSSLDDTNLIYRGGIEGLEYAKTEASRILKCPPDIRYELIEKLDQEFIKRHLSPGGCADMLAIAYFLDYTKKYRRD